MLRFSRKPILFAFFILVGNVTWLLTLSESELSTSEHILERCKDIFRPAGPPPGFRPSDRIQRGSDRHVVGTRPTLIQNAKIWTGAGNGTEIIYGDILLDNGLVIEVGYVPPGTLDRISRDVVVVDALGRWVTPGLVDLHTHIGIYENSHEGPILPWIRSVDTLDTHDPSFELVRAGGVTTAQMLPGSSSNIGGQGFLIKLRSTQERSAISKVLEPPQTLVGNQTHDYDYLHWRHMKHACGENPANRYNQTRMDGVWNFRKAYEKARKLKTAQDAFCRRIKKTQRSWFWRRHQLAVAENFPDDLQWESLVDVLRGRVKISVHCYEEVDLDSLVNLSNEFKFPIASIHHAGEAYLVPEVLKRSWGGTPAVALFAINSKKKREAYRSSEFAPRVLTDHNIPVIMKSDHAVINSRYLLFEAQQAYHYGLDASVALSSVTSTPARAAGVGHRVGYIAPGYDADIVIWDSHPLSLGATPTQVYIDGIAQLERPHVLKKPEQLQSAPKPPNWDQETRKAVEHDGLPPLRGRIIKFHNEKGGTGKRIKFIDVRNVFLRDTEGSLFSLFGDDRGDAAVGRTVVLENGKIATVSKDGEEEFNVDEVIDLQGGEISPGLTTFGSPIGLVEIRMESSTNDGLVANPLSRSGIPAIAGGTNNVIRAVDGLQFEGRNTLQAYRSGVTTAVTPPVTKGFPLAGGFLAGMSATFDLGAATRFDEGAIIQEETALHISISMNVEASVSTQMNALRTMLYASTLVTWERVRQGHLPLVINVHSADIMATLLTLKLECEATTGQAIKMTFSGASEAHIIAHEIAEAGVNVILTNPRPFPYSWEMQRLIPGPPLSQESCLTALLAENVSVAIGIVDEFNARNTRLDVAWAALDSNGTISKLQAMELVTTRLEHALGAGFADSLVAYRGGGLFDMESKVVAVVSLHRGTVEIF